MAIIFQLWAECADAPKARRFADHFSGLSFRLLTGTAITWEAGLESSLGISIWSPDLSRRGIMTVREAIETTEAGIRLLHHLLAAPDFRFAHIGWEAANIPMAELADYLTPPLADGAKLLEVQCVMDDELWADLGHPRNVKLFRPGYRWRPYRGEQYHPLGSQDHQELWDLHQQLLPS